MNLINERTKLFLAYDYDAGVDAIEERYSLHLCKNLLRYKAIASKGLRLKLLL
jgi:hypothetical protein